MRQLAITEDEHPEIRLAQGAETEITIGYHLG